MKDLERLPVKKPEDVVPKITNDQHTPPRVNYPEIIDFTKQVFISWKESIYSFIQSWMRRYTTDTVSQKLAEKIPWKFIAIGFIVVLLLLGVIIAVRC